MSQVEVQIMGQSYLLACPSGAEERFHTAVRKVDAAMCGIRDAGKDIVKSINGIGDRLVFG